MSYVLEALKKAQAQREQGTVPSIHSVQVPLVAVHDKARTNLKPVLWAIAVLLLALVALLVWRMDMSLPAKLDTVPVVVQAAPALAAPVHVPVQVPIQVPAAAAQPTPASAMAPVAESLPSGDVQVPVSAKDERAAATKKERAPRKEAAKKSAETSRVYLVPELPEAIRRELPTLAISGGSYSSNPAQRLIIVNNQVFTEGSEPVPGVRVQRIEPAAAVLSFQGYLYRLGY